MSTHPEKQWNSVCELTGAAMDALVQVEQALVPFGSADLSPLEFRALLWARCALASLYGIRADETVNEAACLDDLLPPLDASWVTALLSD
ncbi:MAG TPA: hypothetical protein VG435_20160 [Acidimicrobiales bacterium]|nr:hypothetical protein [Acidimicrobiales bacterium]